MGSIDDRNPQEANVRVNLYRLAANEVQNEDIGGVRGVFVSKMVSLGSSAGELSIALGKTGDFFDISPGDFIRLSAVRWLRIRNNVNAARALELILSDDPEFRFWNTPRGL
jgi:hypothetical protein